MPSRTGQGFSAFGDSASQNAATPAPRVSVRMLRALMLGRVVAPIVPRRAGPVAARRLAVLLPAVLLEEVAYATRRVAGGETAAVGVGQEQHHFSRQERGQALDRVERLVGEAQARLAFDGPVEADGGRRPGRGVVERCERVRG